MSVKPPWVTPHVGQAPSLTPFLLGPQSQIHLVPLGTGRGTIDTPVRTGLVQGFTECLGTQRHWAQAGYQSPQPVDWRGGLYIRVTSGLSTSDILRV